MDANILIYNKLVRRLTMTTELSVMSPEYTRRA